MGYLTHPTIASLGHPLCKQRGDLKVGENYAATSAITPLSVYREGPGVS